MFPYTGLYSIPHLVQLVLFTYPNKYASRTSLPEILQYKHNDDEFFIDYGFFHLPTTLTAHHLFCVNWPFMNTNNTVYAIHIEIYAR